MVRSSVCYFYCSSIREILETGFWLLYQMPQQQEISRHNTRLLKSWSSLYHPAQQSTGLRSLSTRERVLQEVGSCPGSCFNHQARTVALPQGKNNWISHATVARGGVLLMLPSYLQINILVRGEVSSLYSRKSLQSKVVILHVDPSLPHFKSMKSYLWGRLLLVVSSKQGPLTISTSFCSSL